MLETLNEIKNSLKAQAETQKKLRIVLGQNWNNYSENYRKEFNLQNGENVPMLWTVQNDQRQNTYDLFVQYTAYYIVKHRLQDDYSEYKKQVTEHSYLSKSYNYVQETFWNKVQSYVESWTFDILNELEQRKVA